MRKHGFFLFSYLVLTMAFAAFDSEAQGQPTRRYEVSITNLTKGQTFTPILVATHRKGAQIFELGAEASPEVEAVAESGDTGPLSAFLEGLPEVNDVQVVSGLLGPGQTATVEVDARGPFRFVSVASMLIPTNDGFFGLAGVEGPNGREPDVHFSPAYDAGTEVNEELCADIPGPQCGSGALDAGTEEDGVVHINAAIQGVGDLEPGLWDWRKSKR